MLREFCELLSRTMAVIAWPFAETLSKIVLQVYGRISLITPPHTYR